MSSASDSTGSRSTARRVRPVRPSQRAASVSIAMKQSREAQQRGGQVSSHAAGMNAGLRVLSYLIAGVALYGALGWLADRLLGTSFLLPIGIVLGAAASVYTIIRRFGRVDDVAVPNATTREGLSEAMTEEVPR